jgi:hypothetical protein
MRPRRHHSPGRARSRKSNSRNTLESRDAVADERHASDAEPDFRGFALRSAEERNWEVVGDNERRR